MATATRPSTEIMYRAFLDRDPSYDGVVFMAVKTTGIFCRSTCPARKPKPENVAYFATAAEALRRGFRPCKRCRPTEAGGAAPAWAGRLLEEIEQAPRSRLSDADLLARAIDPSQARRYFKGRFGMTFHAYQRARGMGLALADVRAGGDLLNVGQDSGYDSPSGFRDAFSRHFGEPPGRSRSASCLLARQVETPLGPMLAVAGDDGLCLLEFVDRRAMDVQVATLRRHFPIPVVPGRNAHLDRTESELASYFAGTLTEFTVPLVLPGSPFQAAVWEQLRRIPHGRTMSYGAIAAAIGRPGASQAVGRANGENRLAILVPCHRVIRADGHPCGYAGGLERKRWLLDHERRTAGGGAVDGWLFPAGPPILS